MADSDGGISDFKRLTEAAVGALRQEGWTVEKQPGMARQNVWRMTRGSDSRLVSIRTTRNRWIAYNTSNKGKEWKTLDDVDCACVAAFAYDESGEDVIGIEVHLIEADRLREHFDAGYRIRTEGGQKVTDDFGMWICMDKYDADPLAGGGSGFATADTLIATYSTSGGGETSDKPKTAATVADVVEAARAEIARMTGIGVENITLELRMTI